MEKLTINIYNFKELSPEASEFAIRELSNNIDEMIDISQYIIDDDALLEPKHEDLVKAFGENYWEKFKSGFLINNTRNIQYDIDYYSINISNAIKIDDDGLFLKYLGIPYDLMDKISYEILADEIVFHSDDELSENENEILREAYEKFLSLVDEILIRIESSYKYLHSKEFLVEHIESNDIKFFKSGKMLSYSLKKELTS